MDHPAEDIAAKVVGPEPVVARRSLEANDRIDIIGLGCRDDGRQRRQQADDRKESQADKDRRVLQQLAQPIVAGCG
jgi:hypothetical protein